MTTFISANPELMEFDLSDDQEPHQMRLILTDAAGQRHRLTLEDPAISELAQIFQALLTEFPGLLTVH